MAALDPQAEIELNPEALGGKALDSIFGDFGPMLQKLDKIELTAWPIIVTRAMVDGKGCRHKRPLAAGACIAALFTEHCCGHWESAAVAGRLGRHRRGGRPAAYSGCREIHLPTPRTSDAT